MIPLGGLPFLKRNRGGIDRDGGVEERDWEERRGKLWLGCKNKHTNTPTNKWLCGRGAWPKHNLSPTAGPVSIFMGYSPQSSAEVEPSSNSSPQWKSSLQKSIMLSPDTSKEIVFTIVDLNSEGLGV